MVVVFFRDAVGGGSAQILIDFNGVVDGIVEVFAATVRGGGVSFGCVVMCSSPSSSSSAAFGGCRQVARQVANCLAAQRCE